MKTEFSNRMKDVFNYLREEVIILGKKNIADLSINNIAFRDN